MGRAFEYRKAAKMKRWGNMSRVFPRLGRVIMMAAKEGGGDPDMNPKLRAAILNAKAENMPKDNIQRSIARAADKNAAVLEEITYEGYGPGGVVIIIETATDNKNRTYPEVRTALTKNGGTMADAGSVAFQFTRKGVIRVGATGEDALMGVLEAGAEDAVEEDGGITVYTDMKELASVREAIIAEALPVEDAELQYVANNDVVVDDPETARKLLKVLDALDDVDDVVNVHTNADITVEVDE